MLSNVIHLADRLALIVIERPCDNCRVLTAVEVMERSDVFPLEKVCPGCHLELLDDDADPSDRDHDCGGGCSACLGVPSYSGF